MNPATDQPKFIAHYCVARPLGSGGMGEVFLAEDTKLDCSVAPKLLPKDVAANHSARTNAWTFNQRFAMKHRLSFLVCFACVASALPSQERPIHTYSIVARGPDTGELGVAVQSHWFSVGSACPWAEAGVGAVATQSLVDPAYGPLGLELMRAGKTARQALDGLLASDSGREFRQVAMVDAKGTVAVYTGSNCIPAAGQIAGDQFTVQANLMLNDKVWPAMAKAYRETKGDLASRMLAALDAAQAVGGDIRGKQSAAILIVSGKSTGKPWTDRLMDLRVEDHPEPLKELRRLVQLRRAYRHMDDGDLATERNDIESALKSYTAAIQLNPASLETKYWVAVSMANAGRLEEALPLFGAVFSQEANWRELTPRLRKTGWLKVSDDDLKRILAVIPGTETNN